MRVTERTLFYIAPLLVVFGTASRAQAQKEPPPVTFMGLVFHSLSMQRLGEFDILRSFAIVFLIIGHLTDYVFNDFVLSFWTSTLGIFLALFLFVSGYTLTLR